MEPEQTTELMKKIPKFDFVEPELVKFYKDMVIDNLKKEPERRTYSRFWRWCFPGRKTAFFSKEYQAMHYGIIAFISNKEITYDILSADQISQLLKKIPMYEEPENQAKFYKELIEYNIRKNIKTQMIRKMDSGNNKWWFSTQRISAKSYPSPLENDKKEKPNDELYNFDNNINVFVTGDGRVSELSTSTRGSSVFSLSNIFPSF